MNSLIGKLVVVIVVLNMIVRGFRLHNAFPRRAAFSSTSLNYGLQSPSHQLSGEQQGIPGISRQGKSQTISMSSVDTRPSNRNVADQVGAASLASAAVVAAAAVNAAVGMRQLTAPDTEKTFVFKDGASQDRVGKVDEYGLPLVYDKDLIQKYWAKQGSALSRRWAEFLGYAVPYLTRVITMVVSGGNEELQRNGASLARDARKIFEELGPTYIKMGQMMSVRPDVLPQSALDELKILQDSVQPFDTATAVSQIESELGGELGKFFSEISEEPVAAASLAQVYKAKLASTGEYVAVKIQRPRVLETVSKDLYVLRRAAEVYQGLMDRFAPQQRTNYVALLNEWAIGFYTELDFLNEAANQQRMNNLLQAENCTGMYIPKVFNELCTRRVMVTEWVDGVKLSEVEPQLVRELTQPAQETFSTQLLQIGFFHSDPHPGNILYMNEPKEGAKLALIDFGLVASIKQEDMDTMVSSIIHLANRDYPSLVDDFINLGILPRDCDRAKVVPLMDKALTPYVKGGGAKKYEEELRKTYGMDGSFSGSAGGFQAMTQDALTVLNDIPFSIPPYFALLGKAIVTLEGVALTGNPDYGIIMESYPFVARKLLREDRPEIQRALQEVLYTKSGTNGADGLQANRLSVLLNSAMGVVAKTSDAFVDLDSIPEDSVSLGTSVKFLLSPEAASLRNILLEEASIALDILIRQGTRKAYTQVTNNLPMPPFFGNLLPRPETVKIPFFVPDRAALISSSASSSSLSSDSTKTSLSPYASTSILTNFPGAEALQRSVVPVMLSTNEMLETVAPKLSREEELYALSLTDLAVQTLGEDAGVMINGNALLDPRAASRFLLSIAGSSVAATGRVPGIGSLLTPQQIASLTNILKPLIGSPSSSAAAVDSNTNNNDNPAVAAAALDDVAESLGSLTADEEAVLTEYNQRLLTRLVDTALKRLQVLL